MFVIENYIHIEHSHTKGMGCLKQHNRERERGGGGGVGLYKAQLKTQQR